MHKPEGYETFFMGVLYNRVTIVSNYDDKDVMEITKTPGVRKDYYKRKLEFELRSEEDLGIFLFMLEVKTYMFTTKSFYVVPETIRKTDGTELDFDIPRFKRLQSEIYEKKFSKME